MKSLELSLTGQGIGFIELKTFGRVTGDSISVANIFEGNIASVGLSFCSRYDRSSDIIDTVIIKTQ